MATNFQAPRGFHDVFGQDLRKFRKATDHIRRLLKLYGYEEIITPIIEYAELFERSIGETTDIVQKEMFVFEDKKGRLLALRPEGTAGVVRAFIQNALYARKPYTKLFYEGPMFRYERPQAGRYRQFHQIGAEVFGPSHPSADAEMLKLVSDIVSALDIQASLEINSLGCKVCRPNYRQELIKYLNEIQNALCSTCVERKDRNPLRVLDCKVDSCQKAFKGAPKMVDFLCEECSEHYRELKAHLEAMDVSFRENHKLVRGLDYYTRTVFEAVSEKLGSAIIAGGRYDYLVEEFGGPPTPALGFAVGIERISLLLEEPEKSHLLYFVIPFGNVGSYALKVAGLLRSKGYTVELSYRRGGLRKHLELANKMSADFSVIIGENEVKERTVTIKDMRTGEQRKVNVEDL